MRWNHGRAEVDSMLSSGELQRVPASREHAENLLDQARQHVLNARAVVENDPEGAYAIGYDAARKALAAVLENQGLRATSRGGHVAVYRSVHAQLDPPLGAVLRPFDRMRRRRNGLEYPDFEAPALTATAVEEDLRRAEAIVELAMRTLDEMSPY
jgi:hypothetical protein